MNPELIGLLSQIPLVGIFIWFVLEWTKRTSANQEKRDEQMRKFLDEQRTQDREILSRLINQLDKIVSLLENHDTKTDIAVAKMEERTRPRKTRKESEEDL